MTKAASRHTRSVPKPEDVLDLGLGRGPEWLENFMVARLPEIIRWRRHIHSHPELSNAETATTAFLLDRLTEAGIDARVLPGGTGLIADIGDPALGPTVALRADIDALPLPENTQLPYASTVAGVSHACGHDAHQSVVLGAALALSRAPDLAGRVRIIFQPAEEVMDGGATAVIAAGGVEDVDRIFTLHCDPRLPVGQVGLKSGLITSTSDQIELRIISAGGHSSRPHLTGDLVFALGTVITGLPVLLTRRLDPRSAAVLVWGAVKAGQAANAIPRDGVLKGTLRMMERASWDGAEKLIRELIADLLAPLQVDYELVYLRGVPPVDNDAICTGMLQAGVVASVGAQAVRAAQQSTGAEDFAEYLDHVPGALARLGVWDGTGERVDLHSEYFEIDEQAISVGVRLMVNTALVALRAGAGQPVDLTTP